MSRFVIGICMLPFGLACAFAVAQPVYRCGPDRNVYGQRACAEGAPVEVADPRTPAQRADALALAARERQRAADMAREREKAEKAARPATAAGIAPAPPHAEPAASTPNPRTHRPRARHAIRSGGSRLNATDSASAPGGFVAVVPRARKTRQARSAP